MREIVLCWGLCLGVAVTLLAVPSLRLPTFVTSVTIVNPTDSALRIDVADATQRGWIELGDVAPRSRLTVREVLDQGGSWSFRLRRATDGRSYALLQLTRSELSAAQWSLTIPERFLDFTGSPELKRLDAAEGP